MIIQQIQSDLTKYRQYGDLERSKLLAILAGEMDNTARRLGKTGDMLLDDGANEIIKRHLKHAGITLTMNPTDPTAKLVIELYSHYLASDVMSDAELTRRILDCEHREPKQILRYLKSNYGIAVDSERAQRVVEGIFGN
jgi:hypothetical protein